MEPLTVDTHDLGRDLAIRYGFAVYDAMIVAAALQSGADTLYSEDLQAGLRVDKRLTVRNPFLNRCPGTGNWRSRDSSPGSSLEGRIVQKSVYSFAMKTTLDIDDRLLAQAKELAARERKSLTSLIEEGLTLRIRPSARRASRPGKIVLPVYRGKGGVAKGIDPASNESLSDAADS